MSNWLTGRMGIAAAPVTTPQNVYRPILLDAVGSASGPVPVATLYEAVAARTEFDADDMRPPTLRGEPTAEPSWRRNVRNALQRLATEGRLVNAAHDAWRLPSPDPERSLDVEAAWPLVRTAARRALAADETFASTRRGMRYRVAAVEEGRVTFDRLDAEAAETLSEVEVRRAVVKLNAAGGRTGRRTLHYTVAKEVALVWLHPALRWSADGNSVEVVGRSDLMNADEVASPKTYAEGAIRTVSVNTFERDPAARAACLAHYGARCAVCGMDFGERYGEIGEGFIHVHHLRPLSEIGAEYAVDPVADLRPVCPNCHAMLHRASPPLTMEALRGRLISTAGPSATGMMERVG